MSLKISVVSIALVFALLSLSSCTGDERGTYAAIFERPFSAKISVTNEETEYKATLTLFAIPSLDTEQASEAERDSTLLRDGNIVYTYPQTLADITAVRTGGNVTINVSTVTVTPSASVGQRYVALLDMLDIRSCELLRFEKDTERDIDARRLTFLRSGKELTLTVDAKTRIPILLEGDGTRIDFEEFIYIN